jgi:hypothetical protein
VAATGAGFMVQKFRKKPVVVEAILFDGTVGTGTPIIQWVLDGDGNAQWTCSSRAECERKDEGHWLGIKTLEGIMKANPGDYIIKGVQGEFYPCRGDIFQQTYEAAE